MSFSSFVSDFSSNLFSSSISTPCSSPAMGGVAKASTLKNQWEFDFNWADEEFGDEDFILELNRHYNPKPGCLTTPKPSGGASIPSPARDDVAMTLAPVDTPVGRTLNKKPKKHVTFLIPEAEPAVKPAPCLFKPVLKSILKPSKPVLESMGPALLPVERSIATHKVIQPVVQRQRRNKDKRNKRITKRTSSKQQSVRGNDVITPEVSAPSSAPLASSSTSIIPSSTSLALIPYQNFNVFEACSSTKVTKVLVDSPSAEKSSLLKMALGLIFRLSKLPLKASSHSRPLQPTRLTPIINRLARRFLSPLKSCVQMVTSTLEGTFDTMAKSGSLTSLPLESVPLTAFAVLDISIQAFA